jgi:opacity protein-like surface antigen
VSRLRIGTAVMLALAIARVAGAQEFFVAPAVGVTFQTETGIVDLENASRRHKLAIDVAAGMRSEGWLGVQISLGLYPGFFGGDAGLVASSHVVAATANLMLSAPARWSRAGVRPFALVGGGILHIATTDIGQVFSSDSSLLALTAGAGATIEVSTRFAIRADVKYFRSSFADPRPGIPVIDARYLHFWQAVAGLVLRL